MTSYFRLIDDLTVSQRWHLGVAALADGSEPRLRAGLRYDMREVPDIAVTRPGRPLEFSLTSFAVPFVTPALGKAIVAAAGDDVQLVPVRIASSPEMAILNVVRVLPCLDEQRSAFVKWTAADHRSDLAGQYRQITKLSLDRAAIPPDVGVFRIWGSLVEIVVADRLKAAMEQVGCFGLTFCALDAGVATE